MLGNTFIFRDSDGGWGGGVTAVLGLEGFHGMNAF
jgi:hypothetical protein